MPEELIDPKSTLSGETPEMRDVTNWYFKLTDFNDLLEKYNENDFIDAIRVAEAYRKASLAYVEGVLRNGKQ